MIFFVKKLAKNFLVLQFLNLILLRLFLFIGKMNSELNLSRDQIFISLWDPKQIKKNAKKKLNARKLNCGFLGQITLTENIIEKFLDNGSECEI